MKKIWVLFGVSLGIGIINAYLSAYQLFDSFPGPEASIYNPFVYLPGLLYGIITGVCFVFLFPFTHKALRVLSWTVLSVVTWAVTISPFWSWLTYLIQNDAILPNNYGLYSYAEWYPWSGLVFAGLLTLLFHFIFKKLKTTQHSIIVITGAILGFLSVLAMVTIYLGGNNMPYPALPPSLFDVVLGAVPWPVVLFGLLQASTTFFFGRFLLSSTKIVIS